MPAARLIEVTAPAAEPITVAECKTWLRIEQEFTAEDTLLTALITSARRVFEELTGRALINTTFRAEFEEIPRLGTYIGARAAVQIELPRVPLVSVAWVKYTDPDGAEQTFDGANYHVEAAGVRASFGRIWLAEGAAWPDLARVMGALRVQFVAGYGSTAASVPAEVKIALRLLVAHWYQNRTPTGNLTAELPFSLRALIEQHQVRTIA